MSNFVSESTTVSLLSATVREAFTDAEQASLNQIEQIPDPVERWRRITKILTPAHAWDVHRQLYENNYAGAAVAPVWSPSESDILNSNVGRFMAELGLTKYEDFYQYSVDHPEEFWSKSVQKVGVSFDVPYEKVFDTSSPHGVKSVDYLAKSHLNIVTSCFNKRPATDTAIVYASEGDATLVNITYAQLDGMINKVANAILSPVSAGGLGLAFGDAIGICMPMSVEAVVAYFGIIKAGCAVVSIADSFSHIEIETRMKLSKAKAIFTQDVIYRSNKHLPQGAKVQDSQKLPGATVAAVIFVPGEGETLHSSITLREGIDVNYHTLIKNASAVFEPVSCPASHICNILFSSGTTGEPKAIPWTHATPVKCAIDGYMHQDIQVGDVVAWPTNLGWMMGPWLLFQMINGATIALFGGVTSTDKFCDFVERSKVSMLGLVPSIVKAWQTGNCTKNANWSCVTKFSSSGEASDAVAMQWLSSRAGYKPIIEYCGGTEVAGSYLSSTMVQHNVPSMFSTPVLGNNFIIINDEGKETLQGEIALIPPAMGLSTHLLNRDHHECYYNDMPLGPKGEVLRRHGDEIQAVHWSSHGSSSDKEFKYFRALGRCDDTMNIGGIKVSSVEIERVCNLVEGISETAAIGVSPAAGGPSQLIIYVILKAGNENMEKSAVKTALHNAIKVNLNPLFHVGDIVITTQFVRTASNKIMRRILRDQYVAVRDGK